MTSVALICLDFCSGNFELLQEGAARCDAGSARPCHDACKRSIRQLNDGDTVRTRVAQLKSEKPSARTSIFGEADYMRALRIESCDARGVLYQTP